MKHQTKEQDDTPTHVHTDTSKHHDVQPEAAKQDELGDQLGLLLTKTTATKEQPRPIAAFHNTIDTVSHGNLHLCNLRKIK